MDDDMVILELKYYLTQNSGELQENACLPHLESPSNLDTLPPSELVLKLTYSMAIVRYNFIISISRFRHSLFVN